MILRYWLRRSSNSLSALLRRDTFRDYPIFVLICATAPPIVHITAILPIVELASCVFAISGGVRS
jgi:hypothetical protein